MKQICLIEIHEHILQICKRSKLIYFMKDLNTYEISSKSTERLWNVVGAVDKSEVGISQNFVAFSEYTIFKPKTSSTITSSLNSMKWYIGPLRYHITFSFMIFKKIFTSKTVSTWFAVIGCPNMFVSVFSQIWFVFEYFSTEFTSTYFWSELLQDFWSKKPDGFEFYS